MIKAIETKYDGYLFRSRTEARWAMMFNFMDIRYEYEFEGYNIEGVWYLPDFFFPEREVFAEVKGVTFTLDEAFLASRLPHYCFMLIGNPQMRPCQNEFLWGRPLGFELSFFYEPSFPCTVDRHSPENEQAAYSEKINAEMEQLHNRWGMAYWIVRKERFGT